MTADACLTTAGGHANRLAALAMIELFANFRAVATRYDKRVDDFLGSNSLRCRFGFEPNKSVS